MGAPKKVFNQYLKDKGIRHSEQRELVLDMFLNTEKHLTTIELYELMRVKYPNIGYATVYRAMKVITDAGLAEEVDFGEGIKRYEHKYDHDHHDHLICLKCGNIIEIVDYEIEKLQEKVADEHGFSIIRHKLQIFGVCKKCNNKK